MSLNSLRWTGASLTSRARSCQRTQCVYQKSYLSRGSQNVFSTNTAYRAAAAASTNPPAQKWYDLGSSRNKTATTLAKPPRNTADAIIRTTSNATSTSTPEAKATTTAAKPTSTPATPAFVPSGETETRSLSDGLLDEPLPVASSEEVDWSRSFQGLSHAPFSPEAQAILLQKIPEDDVEIKPDGIIYLPEIKYRRILNAAFGPGGWGLAPRGETIVTGKLVTREYGLVVAGRLVSIARGEQQYFDAEGIPTATEGCKSNALMRCCKDLGIASELWDPRFVRKFIARQSKEVWVEHVTTKKRKKIYMRKDDVPRYPFKEVS